MIFDTETTSLDKPFCYDIGYIILDTDTQLILERKHFIAEQTWHNLPLFESAYYKEKRPLYVQLMRQRKARMDKWGYIMREMARDMRTHNVEAAYAYNSPFDDKVFTFNCDWFKCVNPLENTPVYDIWGYASQFITNTEEYRDFCEVNELFTESGNYKGSAEAVFQFIQQDPAFIEAHMGLYDVEIEMMILLYCIEHGAEYHKNYKVNKYLTREILHPFTIKINGQEIIKGEYLKKYVRNDIYNFTVKMGE